MLYNLNIYDDTFTLKAVQHKYINSGSLAVILEDDETQEWFAVLTVNLTDRITDMVGVFKEDVQTVDVNNCPWAPKFIEENKLGVPLGLEVKSGFCSYPVYKFNLDMLDKEELQHE